jgi:hypothetical protein
MTQFGTLHLEPWQWAVAFVAAFLIGVSKTGIAGIGTFAVALFALFYKPVAASAGAVLPILIAADCIAVITYHRHAVWPHLWRLMPWAAAGIVLGYLGQRVLKSVADPVLSGVILAKLIGGILLFMVAFQIWRQVQARRGTEDERIPDTIWFAACMGLLAGFTTQIANAAGPIMILYLLAMRLPKMEFIGTGAWYFLILNCFKVPFSVNLGYITPSSLLLDACVIPVALLGALCGRAIIGVINQRLFESLALLFTVIAALKLVLS